MTLELTHARAILAEFEPGAELLQVGQPADGMVNCVHFLDSTRGDLVLKIFDDWTGSWKPQKEEAIHAHMRSIGIPAAPIRLIDTSKRIVPYIYSITDRLSGTPYSLSSMPSVWRRTARFTRRLAM